MNMLFLDNGEDSLPLPLSDPRAGHIINILKKGPGDRVFAGLANGSLGFIKIQAIDNKYIHFFYEHEKEAAELNPIILLLGMPRPIQAKRMLKELTSLGIMELVLSGTELGEKSYLESNFIAKAEYRSTLIEGAVQAGNPRLPSVEKAWTLKKALTRIEEKYPLLKEAGGQLWAMDPYRAKSRFGSACLPEASWRNPLVLAIGSERGWTESEIGSLEACGFSFASLGTRILKTETAAIAAVSIALASLGLV